MRERILAVMEKNSRIDIKDLAILLGESEVAVANEIAQMEKEHIICGYHTLINWDNTSDEKVVALIEVKVTPPREAWALTRSRSGFTSSARWRPCT